jgi:hypothetical protein
MCLLQVTNEEMKDIENECHDLIQHWAEENALQMSSIKFFEGLVENTHEFIFETGTLQGWCADEDDDEEEVYDMVYSICEEALYCMKIPFRQNPKLVIHVMLASEIESKLVWLKTFPNHTQRTAEWYAQRHNLFSASNLWKLFGTQAQYNSLIYEKCNDVKKVEFEGDILTPNARNWGVKYEPVSVMVYEHKYDTIVNTNYGCIPHTLLPIGASPDGINEKPNHEKYGRMLEIKNIYNREMDGIPSKEYWTQMQIQMETCGLEHCDFLETRFKEYTREEFIEDSEHEYKGAIMFFISRDDCQDVESKFVYVPLFLEDIDKWMGSKKEEMSSHVLYVTTYWYLDELCCSLVERNNFWFQSTIEQIKEGWETVLKERNDGFAHRAPQSKKKTKIEDWTVCASSIANMVNLVKLDENGRELEGDI